MHTSPPNEPDDPCPDWHDSFQEPRTIPGGWDLSEILPSAWSSRGKRDESGWGVRNTYGAAQNPA